MLAIALLDRKMKRLGVPTGPVPVGAAPAPVPCPEAAGDAARSVASAGPVTDH
jgi:hypothetical protein